MGNDQLREEARALHKKYLGKYHTSIAAAQETLAPSSKSVEDIREEFVLQGGGSGGGRGGGGQDEPWYVCVINAASPVASREDALMKMVLEEMSQVWALARFLMFFFNLKKIT